jgi:Distinct helicase family with a unique C-terminal domain including a metal-binding cysteine cluster
VDAVDTLDAIAADPEFFERLVYRTNLPARAARTAPLRSPLHPEVTARLDSRGIGELFTHQAQAIDLLHAGTSVVVATGTASGKSLCYQLPIVDAAVRGATDTALLIFPTKALAQDQLRSLRSWLVPGLRAVTYDGDTPPDDRTWARKNATVLLSNPEMIHQGMLPYHQRWSTFLMRLQLVVVDELHATRGIFGSHVANLLRRLRRVCAHYGSNPTFCFASATIGNPAELASTMLGAPVTLVDNDGSPQAERGFALWQRPLLDATTGTRASANVETAELLSRFVAAGHPTLAFTRSRRGAELVASHARRLVADRAPMAVDRIAAYRSGYLADERRALERQLTNGELLGVAATNALELGIDVGGLDAVVLNGFPGTLASLRQQAGRAGRSGQRAAAVLVAGDDQLDQWYASHPTELFTRTAEAAVVNPQNPFVLRPHVACAAHELPLTPDDSKWFGDGLDDAVRDLVQDDLLKPRAGKMFWAGRRPPAPEVGLRSGTNAEFTLVSTEGDRPTIGTVDGARIYSVAHPGAIYLHQGRQWQVEELDVDGREAHLTPADDLDEYTQAREETDIAILDAAESVVCGFGHAYVGIVEVTNQVVAYQRKRASTGESLEIVPLGVPPRTLTTQAVWYTLTPEVLTSAGVAPPQILGAVHAAEHAMIGMLPLFAICDRWDVGGVSMAAHPATGLPTIFIYDGYPGGAGIARLAFADITEHIRATAELVDACPCESGCPSCVQSPKCGNWNEYLDKDAARSLLHALRGEHS